MIFQNLKNLQVPEMPEVIFGKFKNEINLEI